MTRHAGACLSCQTLALALARLKGESVPTMNRNIDEGLRALGLANETERVRLATLRRSPEPPRKHVTETVTVANTRADERIPRDAKLEPSS